MIIALIPFVFAVLGILIYFLSSKPEVKEVGRLMYGGAFLVLMFVLARTVLHLP